jgi:4-hydroxy-tetrahydrodipicolinate synthase
MKKLNVKGVIAAVVTPIDSKENLDENGLRRLITHLIKGGINGLFVLGSCGEGPALTDKVKLKTVEVTVEEAASNIPVFAGALETSTMRAVEFSSKLKSAGADAVVILPPYYFSAYDDQAIINHYSSIAAKINLPVIAYNLPIVTTRSITVKVFKELVKIENIISLKDSSGNFDEFLKILDISKENNFPVYQGIESLAGSSLLSNADGIVMGGANIIPSIFTKLYKESTLGNIKIVLELQKIVNQLISVFREECFYSSMKYALEVLGICSGRVTEPMPTISETQKKRIKKKLKEINII